MPKVLLIIGGTGNQGGSVVSHVLHDPELSQQYTIRAMTRDPSKTAALSLKQHGVEVVQADLSDRASITHAMHGVHTIFAVTTAKPDDPQAALEIEQGKAMADAAVAAGVSFLIFSTLPNVTEVSGGKYRHVYQFDSKAKIEAHIRGLAPKLRSAFFAPGTFMANFGTMMKPRPSYTADRTYAWSNVVTPQTQFPLIDVPGDTGKWIGAILANPEKYEGKTLTAATRLYTQEEVTQALCKVTGKIVKYQQLPVEVFKSFLPPGTADQLVEMMLYFQDFGYYGPGTQDQVDWSAQQARGKPTTFEEYLAKAQLDLDAVSSH